MKYYLIDYENVHVGGLSGCSSLTKTDHIIIFFTKNATKIDMSEIAKHGEAELEMIEVPAGKQSTDIHIGSYVGYLVGTHNSKDCSIVVISKDKDFDNVIKFWMEMTKIKITRSEQIKSSTPKKETTKQAKKSSTVKTQTADNEKTKLAQKVFETISKAGFGAAIANTTSQIVANLYGEENFSVKVHNKLHDKYENYLDIYGAIKPILSKCDKSSNKQSKKPAATKKVEKKDTTKVENKTQSSSKVEEILKAAGYNKVIPFVITTIKDNDNKKNKKNLIYRAIVKKCGQSEGLKIYTQIKKHI